MLLGVLPSASYKTNFALLLGVLASASYKTNFALLLGVLASASYKTVKLLRYVSWTDFTVLACEVIL